MRAEFLDTWIFEKVDMEKTGNKYFSDGSFY